MKNPSGTDSTVSGLTGPNWFWSMVWVWSLEDVQLFMKQRDKVLNAPSKRRRYRASKSKRQDSIMGTRVPHAYPPC